MAKLVKQMTNEEVLKIVKQAIDKYVGDVTICESAVGALLIGREFGYDVLRVLHSSTTLKRYGAILDIDLKEKLRHRTPQSSRVRGIRIADEFGKFWQALGAGLFANSDAKVADSKS